MDNYFVQDTVNTTLTTKSALLLGTLVTAATVLGVAHGHHTEKTPSQLQSFTVHNMLRTSRREDKT